MQRREWGAARLMAPAIAMALGALAFSAAAPAKAQDETPSTYLVTSDFEASEAVQVAKRRKPMAQYTVRPESVIELQGDLDPLLGKKMAMKPKHPLVQSARLFGFASWPGLYCDLMRNRGLGSSAICLRDNDADGAMDEVVRYDFNSGDGDVVFLTDKGKVRGGYLKKQQELSPQIPYTKLDDFPDAEKPTGKVYLLWDAAPRAQIKDGRGVIDLAITDGPNFTGTQILSERLLRMPVRGQPITADFYGTKLEIVGLNEKNRLEYRLLTVSEERSIPFVFRGYTLEMIIIYR